VAVQSKLGSVIHRHDPRDVLVRRELVTGSHDSRQLGSRDATECVLYLRHEVLNELRSEKRDDCRVCFGKPIDPFKRRIRYTVHTRSNLSSRWTLHYLIPPSLGKSTGSTFHALDSFMIMVPRVDSTRGPVVLLLPQFEVRSG
jgi:hypothetical protein